MSELTRPETQSFLERAVRDQTIDVAKLEQLIALQERVAAREARRQFAEAMNALQEEMPAITKDRINPYAKSRYATYEAIDAVLRPIYTRHGFSVRFTTSAMNNRIRVGCTVSHIGGHSESEHSLESGPDLTGARGQPNKTEVQGIGSIVSYLKRYTLMAAFAVAIADDETDDDGGGPPDQGGKKQSDDQVPSLRKWFDAYEAAFAAPKTAKELEEVLKVSPSRPPEWMADMPNAQKRFMAVRQAAFDRLGLGATVTTQQPDLPIEGEEKAGA